MRDQDPGTPAKPRTPYIPNHSRSPGRDAFQLTTGADVTFCAVPTPYTGVMTMMSETSSAAAFSGVEQTDQDVIRQVLDGNSAVFELLMRRYNERVYRAARAIVRDEQEAED